MAGSLHPIADPHPKPSPHFNEKSRITATSLDERAGAVILYTNDPKRPIPFDIEALIKDNSPSVVVDANVNGFETTSLARGGHEFRNGGLRCTAGFAVKAASYRGIMTAGHDGCGNAFNPTVGPVSMCCRQFSNHANGQDRSIYAVANSGDGVSRYIRQASGAGNLAINGYYLNSSFFVGFVSKKSGITSAYRKGKILSTTFDPTSVPGSGYFLQMTIANPSYGGDSGGPNWMFNSAVGITSACQWFQSEGFGAHSCNPPPGEPFGYNRAIVGKIQAQLSDLGPWSLYHGVDGG